MASSNKHAIYNSDDTEAWVMYKDRAEWKDVTPLKQNDGPVVKILYSDHCKHEIIHIVLKVSYYGFQICLFMYLFVLWLLIIRKFGNCYITI